MKYAPPLGSVDPDAPYVDRDTPGAVRGSVVPAAAVEAAQREIVEVIETMGGLTPDENDNTQLRKAIEKFLDVRKTPFNVDPQDFSTRDNRSGLTGTVTFLSGIYTKQSDTSVLVISFSSPSYVSTAAGPVEAVLEFDDGTTTVEKVTAAANNLSGSGRGETTFPMVAAGLDAGDVDWSYKLQRGDATTWGVTVNPNSTDNAQYSASGLSTVLIIQEVEPSA